MYCFINSVLQVLGVCPDLRDFLLGKIYDHRPDDANNNVAVAAGNTIHKMYRAEPTDDVNWRPFEPWAFHHALSLVPRLREFASLAGVDYDNGHELHDVMDFFEALLDTGLGDEVVNNVIGGKRKVTLKCLTCETERTPDDGGAIFRTLHVNFEDGRSGKTLIECLEYTCGENIREGVECSPCSDGAGDVVRRDHVALDKLCKLPRVLFIQLVRHRFGSSARKNGSKVECPLDLDLASLVDESIRGCETKYTLVGVINHQGGGHCSGHCTADICFQNKWYRCNDEIVEQYEGGFVVNDKEAYVLAYRRNDVDAVKSF
jgi:ubiquitin C-terminal hydrolase